MSAIDSSASSGPAMVGVTKAGSHSYVAPVSIAVALLAVPLIVFAILIFAVLPLVPWWAGTAVGAIAAVIIVLIRLGRAHDVVVASFESGTSDSLGVERAGNLLQSLSLACGMAEPELRIATDPSRNAAVIRRGSKGTIIVTSGLVDSVDVIQMEGVVAQLLARLKNGDAEQATVGAALFGLPILGTGLNGVLGPVARYVLDARRHQDRDLRADREAVSLTRYPPGLRAALGLIGEGPNSVVAVPESLAHMWMVEPTEVVGGRSERASLELRRDALAEL